MSGVMRARPRLRYVLWVGLAAGAVLVGLGSYTGKFGGNTRVVDPGRVYRSAQLTGSHLTEYLSSKRIRSVVNLRGDLPDDAALRDERAVCRRLSVAHVDIGLDPNRLPGPAAMQELLHALDTLPRPLLIHCAAGSDRTGLASAIYLNVYRGMPLEEARARQLTWRYGHWPIRRGRAMDQFLDLYRQTGRGRTLRAWVVSDYPQIYAQREGRSP